MTRTRLPFRALRTQRTRTTTPPHGSWCEVTVAELEGSPAWLLAGYHAPTPHLARLWLRWQSARLADLIDPDPGAPWLAASVLHHTDRPDQPDDPAAALRRWPGDAREYARLQQALDEGSLYVFTVTDAGLRYSLSHRSLLPSGPRHARRPRP